jgi:hypothetical protein
MSSPAGGPRRSRAMLAALVLALSCLFALSGVSSAAPAPAAPSPALPRGSRIPAAGGSYFLSGVNYPQYRYYGGDIATLASVDQDCVWYYDSAFDYTAIDHDFAEMQASGVHTVRWWLFGDGRGAPEFDRAGKVTGLDATFFAHMDQAMQIAARHNIYIIWSLWDFLAFEHGNWLCGGAGMQQLQAVAAKMPASVREAFLNHVKMAEQAPAHLLPQAAGGDQPDSGQQCMVYAGGHRNLVTDTAAGGAQDSFFNNALIPMLQRYRGNPNVIGWEIMNEPEWTLNPTPETGGAYPQVQEPVDLAQMRQFFARFTQAVHTYAPGQYATVGGASLKFLGFGTYIPSGLWQGLGFDYYGEHYYGWMDTPANNGNPLAIDYNSTAAKIDAPVVIGEFPAHGGTQPAYLPSIRTTGSEASVLSLRYICGSYAPASEPPCTRSYTVKVDYYTPAGAIAGTDTITLPPYGGWTAPAPAGGAFTGAARVTSNGPVAAVITQTGMLSAGEQVAYTGQDKADTTLWLPRVTNQGAARTRIAVQNTDVHAANVTITYYTAAGAVAATDNFTLGPRGSTLIDPLLGGGPAGPPAGFTGTAVIVGTSPLVGVASLLDPAAGSDAYEAQPQGYMNEAYLPSVRNWGANGDPTIYLQNACCGPATTSITYYNTAGAPVASQRVTVPLNGAAVVQPQDVLVGGFEGSAIITSDGHPSAVMRSVAGASTAVYAATQFPDQRLHFPVTHHLNADGSGPVTSISAQNLNASNAITLWVTVNDAAGNTVYFANNIVVPPHGLWTRSINDLPGVPAGFSGTAEILWPYPNGWNAGFPLMAVARDLDGAHTSGSTYDGVASHSFGWAVTAYQPRDLLEGIYANHWAGALAWSYYDNGTGSWADYQEASAGFNAAHPADLAIGSGSYTPQPTPANPATATAAAATPTTAWGNPATATAQAGLTGTPQPPCVAASPTPAACTIHFSDVQPTDYFYAPVQYLFCHNIVSGYADGTFRPANTTTRGQFSKMLVLGRGWALSNPAAPTFRDVPASNPFYPFVETAYQHGAISGYACGAGCLEFRPNNDITRGQISKLIALAMGWPMVAPTAPTFRDVPSSNPFFGPIETVYRHGVISGYACGAGCLEFRPNANATRGQLSKMLYNAITNP